MEPFLGQIQAFGFSFAPRGWATCQGQILSISQNTALFSLLGTTYGGNGQTTFALPDLRGRAAIGQGQGPGLSAYTIGEVGGAESTSLTTANLPMHNHLATSTPHTHTATSTAHTHTATATSTLYAQGVAGDKASPQGRTLAGLPNLYKAPDPAQYLALYNDCLTTAVTNDSVAVAVTNDAVAAAVTIAPAGSSMPFDNRGPYLCINMCIALEGIFPSRN